MISRTRSRSALAIVSKTFIDCPLYFNYIKSSASFQHVNNFLRRLRKQRGSVFEKSFIAFPIYFNPAFFIISYFLLNFKLLLCRFKRIPFFLLKPLLAVAVSCIYQNTHG